MAVNTIEYASLFQTALDDQMIQGSTTAWMEPAASTLIYNGGNTIKIPKIFTEGLGDYSRSAGFPDGAVTFEYESYTFEKDRGKEFVLDSQDIDESNFGATAPAVMKDFQNRNVIPEVDSYRYSRIFEFANQGGQLQSYTPDSSTIYSQIKADLVKVQDIVGDTEPLVIAMTFATANILDESDKITKYLRVDEFQSGVNSEGKAISTKVSFLDTTAILRVSSKRLKSLYVFSATNGFSVDDDALNINYIIMAKSAALAVSKTAKIRIFTPEANQKSDGFLIQYRKYHTLIVPDNKIVGVFASYTPSVTDLSVVIAAGSVVGATKATATAGTDNTLAYKLTASEQDDLSKGIVLQGGTAYVSAADIAVTAGQWLAVYAIDGDGKVVSAASHELESSDIKLS